MSVHVPAVTPETRTSELVPVYVWEIPVRVAHWLIAGAIVVLAATGLYIGYPFATASGPELMGWARYLHAIAAYVFTASVLVALRRPAATLVMVRLIWSLPTLTVACGSPPAKM